MLENVVKRSEFGYTKSYLLLLFPPETDGTVCTLTIPEQQIEKFSIPVPPLQTAGVTALPEVPSLWSHPNDRNVHQHALIHLHVVNLFRSQTAYATLPACSTCTNQTYV